MLIQTNRDLVHNNIETEEDTIEVVDNFRYLGVNLAKIGSEEPEIKRRTTMDNKAYFALLPSFRSGDVHTETKMKIYRTVIRPLLCLSLIHILNPLM